MDVGANCPADLRQWLTLAVEAQASDLHVAVGYPPMIRQHGELKPLEYETLNKENLDAALLTMLTEPMRAQLQQAKNLDFSITLPIEGNQRFRVNYFYAARTLCGCFESFRGRSPVTTGPVFLAISPTASAPTATDWCSSRA